MGATPLPTYEQLMAMAGDDEESVDRFIRGVVLNPPRQSPWSWWKTRHLRRVLATNENNPLAPGMEAPEHV